MAQTPPLKTLDDLLAQAEHYAGWAMRKIGNVPPTMMGLSPRGPLFFVPSAMTDDRAKDNFANTSRLICVAHDATAAVLILESWMKLATPGETLDTTEAPSEAIDRKEIVLLTGETRTSVKQKILPIIRTGVGGFFGFGEHEQDYRSAPQGRQRKSAAAKFFQPHLITNNSPWSDLPPAPNIYDSSSFLLSHR